MVRKEWKSTSEKEQPVFETEKKEHAVGSGGDDNHSVAQKVPTELPGNEWNLSIEKEQPEVQEEHEQVEGRGDDGHSVAEHVPTGPPESSTEDRNMTTRNREDNTREEDHHQGRGKKDKGHDPEPNIKNIIEQYLIGTSGTSTPSRASGGNKETIHQVKK